MSNLALIRAFVISSILLVGAAAFCEIKSESQDTRYYLGSVGELQLLERLDLAWDHSELEAEVGLLGLLGEALDAGVITGYDLRARNVYERLEGDNSLIYSHGSKLHLQALVNLLAGHRVSADVYLLPKVSAFLHRPQWGGDPEKLGTLPNGLKVVNGREAAVLFVFSDGQDKEKFHAVVQRYAKKNHEDQEGLIINAWWQPFYYSSVPFLDFSQIDLVVLRSNAFEATLTVLPHNTQSVVDVIAVDDVEYTVDEVWVNPAFHRFLQGDYR